MWEFEPLSTQQTRVTATESNGGFLISLFYGREQLATHLEGWLGALKREAERRSDPQ